MLALLAKFIGSSCIEKVISDERIRSLIVPDLKTCEVLTAPSTLPIAPDKATRSSKIFDFIMVGKLESV